MRVVLDTNILLSALITRGTPPDQLYEAWRHGRFDLAFAEQQLEELNRVSRRPFFLERLKPSEVGRMVNDIRRLAVICDPLPSVRLSHDPADDFLLAVSQVASADYLVTGDKNGLLNLKSHGCTQITAARELVQLLR
jgi:uncharacterized protein